MNIKNIQAYKSLKEIKVHAFVSYHFLKLFCFISVCDDNDEAVASYNCHQ